MFFEKHYGKILLGMCGSLLLLGAITIGSAAYNLSTPTPQIITKKNKKKDEKDEYIEKHQQHFVDSYDSSIDYNENIQKEFYIKEDYDKLIVQNNNILESSWKHRILIEHSPLGNIIMFYDAYKQGFSYYCDVNIPYNILNCVAMKYVLKYFCRDFFIDNSIVPKNVCSPFLHMHEIEKSKENRKKIDVTKGPFAKLKTYKPESKNGVKQKEQKMENFIKNKFIMCGKIYQFSPLQSVPKKAIKRDIPMKYSSFKQWHNPERFDMISDTIDNT
jgi:hypothetical protein